MQLFCRQVSAVAVQPGNFERKLLCRITTQIMLLAAAVAVAVACYSWRSVGIVMPGSDFGPPAPEIAGAYGIGGQQSIPIDQGRFSINVDAFNYQRQKHISLESAELLSVANALKRELARNPDAPPSAAALEKAAKIEKLARDVKEQMKYNPGLGPI